MQFQKYNSIENHYRDKFLMKVFNEGKTVCDEWFVLEKIDGANFSFYTDGKVVKVGKRSGFIPDGHSFFSCWEIYAKYQESVLAMHSTFCNEGDVLSIKGELFGKGVINRVNYGDGRYFAAFDISINDTLVTQSDLMHMCECCDIPIAPVLGVYSSLEEALNYDVEKSSTWVESEEPNIMEGVVIKPNMPLYLNNGARVIIKKKSLAFLEVEKKPHNNKNKDKDRTLSDDQQDLVDDISRYLTESRLMGVVSKIGEVSQKDFGKLHGLFVRDAIDDYQKDHEVNLRGDLDSSWLKVNRAIQNRASGVVREHWLNILDSNT